MAEEPDLRDLEIGDGGWIIGRHAEVYADEAGFDITFEALVAEVVARFIRSRDPARERAFIALQGGRRVGCLLCTRLTDDIAKIRLLLVEPGMRRQGIGRLLLQAAMAHARAHGFRSMGLWTFDGQRAAEALYISAGFRLVTSHPARSFGRDVVEQEWEILL
ncbi:GNAT family N-acetyltransferase [Cereibacter sphaeroides]|uniref:GNAT family N-acetyltransferase n=1 Tax=Rhodobacterales TaxID=204455 RepID=UPI000BBE4062|nr:MULTISPECIES: GNAT family N-acetyltransferase [Paracoccaceae]MCE6960245.1 GNAT family N-acetyltransferase [Cereibacter sphaeroides]MCE6969195.1 GNAT family N-acetyltransferase [Cereibacter sphaeroides]MCE6974856.1 GNAT family N-acetyltransferase [Cereibacter sphaeroides]